MAIEDDNTPEKRMEGIAPGGLAWGHLTGTDERTPEQKAEAQRKETRRRRGKVRGRQGNWWDSIPD